MSKSSNTFYGHGFIGALIYNMQYADGFVAVLWGVAKSLFWPAFLIYKVFLLLEI